MPFTLSLQIVYGVWYMLRGRKYIHFNHFNPDHSNATMAKCGEVTSNCWKIWHKV